MKRIKLAIANAWRRFRVWGVSILVALGLVTVALAGTKYFAWTNPTQNTDGSVFNPATDQAETRIYCGISPTAFVAETPTSPQTETPKVVSPGNSESVSVEFLPGSYSCFATVVNVDGYESAPSNVTTFTIEPKIPNPPVLN